MKSILTSFVVLSLLVSAAAEAQEPRPERPYRGLFAGGITDAEQLLTVRGSAGAGWDKSLVFDERGRGFLVGDGSGDFRSAAYTGSAALSFSLDRGAVAFGASASTTGRYHPGTSNAVLRRDYINVGASAALGEGFSARAAASYQPYSLKTLLPSVFGPRLGDPAIADEDFPSSLDAYLTYSGGLDFSKQLSRRHSFTATYDYHAREAFGLVARHDRHTAQGLLTRAISNGLDLVAGYGFVHGRYADNPRGIVNHRFDAGVNYSRALSFSRRTTVAFGTGTSAAGNTRTDTLRYHAIGNARLNHEIGRTWNASVAYIRAVQFVDAWPQPMFSDSAVARLAGLVNRRTEIELTARTLHGRELSDTYGGLDTYNGLAALRVALSRHIGTSLTYSYYRHRFDEGVALAPGFPADFDGQSIRAAVNVWFPLFQSARRP